MSDSDDDETYTAEEAATFSLGFNVCVCGLTSKPELNGRMGAITKAFDAESGRINVQVEGTPKPIALKPANLAPSGLPAGVQLPILPGSDPPPPKPKAAKPPKPKAAKPKPAAGAARQSATTSFILVSTCAEIGVNAAIDGCSAVRRRHSSVFGRPQAPLRRSEGSSPALPTRRPECHPPRPPSSGDSTPD